MVPFIRFYVDPLSVSPSLSLSLSLSASTPTSSCPRLRPLYNGNRESQMAIYASLVPRRSRPFASLLSRVSRGGVTSVLDPFD